MFKRLRDPEWRDRPASENQLALWSASKRWPLAVAIAGLPVVFILDQAVDWDFSPVLPGALVLILIAVLGPFALMEWSLHRRKKQTKDSLERTRLAEKKKARGRTALVVAVVWALLWLSVGV